MIWWWMAGCLEGPAPARFDLDYAGATVPALEAHTLELDSVVVTLSDVHLVAPDPVWTALPSLVSAAYAHPGHEVAGAVRGELLGQWRLDLFDDAQLGRGAGFAGPIEGAEVLLEALEFRGRVDGRPFALDQTVDRQLPGIPVDIVLDSEGSLVLGADLQLIVDRIVWDDANGDGLLNEDDTGFANSVTFAFTTNIAWAITPE